MWFTYLRVRSPSVAPHILIGMIMEFKSSDSAKPSEPVAPVPYSPGVRGTVAPTVVDPADIAKQEIAQEALLLEQDAEGVSDSLQLEKELNSLGVPDEMQKFMQIALRKPHLITITYLSNTGRFQHYVNVHNRFPKQDIAGVLEHLKGTSAERWLKKPDMTQGFRDQLAQKRKQNPNRGPRRLKGKGKGKRR